MGVLHIQNVRTFKILIEKSNKSSNINKKAAHMSGFFLERVMGIEPTRPAWKAGVLPLNYTRIFRF